MSHTKSNFSPIAIVGVSALFPGSQDARGFWRDILSGQDLLTDVPAGHWLIDDYFDADPSAPDKTYARRGGFLDKVDFDALAWGVPPSTVPATDTSQLLALILAQQVLQDALGAQFESADRSRTSVILGVTSAQELLFSMVSRLQRPVWVKALRESGLPEAEVQAACDRIAAEYVPWQEASFPGLLGNVVAGRIANRLNLGGTNCVTDAACASSFSALSMAVNELQLGHSDLVISGGVDTLNDIFMYMCFSKTPALSPSGDCRPFSDQADGTMLGEGLGMVALKRLEDAERDGDHIYAVVRGIGTSSDGRSKSVYAPVSEGQAKALRRAYEQAGYGPETVELMEAHGTGTKAGDVAEFEGLRQVFAPAGGDRKQWCALGSVKSQIGHTKAAAGAAGLFKAVMALHHKILPPTIKVQAPNPKLDLPNSPFHINTEARPWIRDATHPRRASVSAFGFGGSNFHVTLEEYLGPAARPPRLHARPHDLFAVGAAGTNALLQKLRAARTDGRPLAELCRESRDAWNDAGHRLCVVAATRAEFDKRLDVAIARIEADATQPFTLPDGSSYGLGAHEGKVALLFPGQGSQYPGMGAELAMHLPIARAVWDRAASLTVDDARSLPSFVFPVPKFSAEPRAEDAQLLTRTQIAQPAIGCASLALLDVLRELGVQGEAYAGHSFGELTALHAAEAFDAAALLDAARQRGRVMCEAAKSPGAMLALPVPIDQARDLIAGHDLVVANHNAPNQVIVSGAVEAVEALEAKLSKEGITGKRLPVATAFHSRIVAGACDPFAKALDGITMHAPKRPVIANATAAPYGKGVKAMRSALAAQLAEPVRFVECIEALYAQGARTFVEVGPASVLTGLVGAILDGKEHRAIALDRKGKSGLESLLIGLSRMAAAGVPVALQKLFADEAPVKAPLKPKGLALPINGSNYGKPYPPADPASLPKPNPSRPDLPRPVAAVQVPVQSAAVNSDSPASSAHVSSPQLPTAAVAAASVPNAKAVSAAWLQAFQEQQQQTAAAHAAFQRAMFDSHAAYLQLAASALQNLSAAGGPGVDGLSNTVSPLMPTMPTPVQVAQVLSAPIPPPPTQPAAMPAAPSMPAVSAMPMPAKPATPIMAPNRAVAQTAPAATPALNGAAAHAIDFERLMLEVVSEKTGYPVDMLKLDMDLEGDLGIDSIKRVEILAALDERAPNMPKVDRSALSALHTLGEIVDYLHAAGGVAAKSSVTPAASATHVAAPVLDLEALMLEVVAEKTGYPVGMLKLDMDLEGDLGIDSIKRVEILAALDERAPNMPKVDRAALSALHTLGEIVDYLRAAGGAIASSNAPLAAAERRAAAPVIDLEALMLGVVAEKTGYPVDMLKLDMDLEGDLGIDSIKRVEILAALDERAPSMPKVDRAALSTLHTLGEIVDYLRSAGGLVIADSTVAVAATPSAPLPSIDLEALMLDVVAEKTGYPVDMLKLDMDLEGDLGIDSIKRVEILAALDERAPSMPKVDRAALSALHTLGEIVDYLRSAGGTALNGVSAETKQTAAASVSQMTAPALGRYALDWIAAPASGLAMAGLLGGSRVWVTGDPARNALLVEALRLRGVNAQASDAPPAAANACIYLGGLRAIADIDAAKRVNREAFALARQLAKHADNQRVLFVTVQDTGGSFGLDAGEPLRAWSAGLPALIKTAALEWPKAVVKAIDIARGQRDDKSVFAALADELLLGGGEIEIALDAQGQRRSLVSVPVEASAPQPVIEQDDVVVISGGGRGVTAACLKTWAGASKPRFVLLGRTALQIEPASCRDAADEPALKAALLKDAGPARPSTPAELQRLVDSILANREITATLDALREAGAEARYEAVDVADSGSLSRVLDVVRGEWGPIRGVVHAAGVLADKRIADKTDAQFDKVFDTKIEGLRTLLQATSSDPLKLLAVFSSVSARCGNTGQADYAMANEVLAKVMHAEARSRPGLRVKSLGWGPWEAGMVSPQLKKRFAELGVPMIPLDVGAQMFVDEVNDASGAVELVLGGAPKAEALLFDGAKQRVHTLEVRVHRDSHGYLDGHTVNGMPVVPVVLVAEWLSRAARSFRPGLVLSSLRDLKVLKGIRLGGFDSEGDRFLIEATPIANGAEASLQLVVKDAHGTAYYSARAELHRASAPGEQGMPELALDTWKGEPLYQNLLFHRGKFELIESVRGISDQGVGATLRGVDTAGWTFGPWQLDVAALDGGLQMAVLFGQRMLGGPNLPTSIDELRTYTDAPIDGPVHAQAYRRKVSGNSVTTDILFTDREGRRFAELLGVQNHALPRA